MTRFVRCLAFVIAGVGASAAWGGAQSREVEISGARLRIDAYRPAVASAPASAVLLAHGFLRTPATMAGYAEALAADGYLALVPALPSRIDSRENGRALAALVTHLRAGGLGVPVDRVVLVGFSAGGLAAMLAAGTPGVAGYVGLDAFDRPGGPGLEAARALRAPAALLHGPAAFCNAYNISAPWRTALAALVLDQRIEGASHCDFEWPTDSACVRVCGEVHEAAQAAIRAQVRQAVRRFLPRGPA